MRRVVAIVAAAAACVAGAACGSSEDGAESARHLDHRADVAALLERAGAWLGDDEARAVRALVAGAEASAVAEDGDVVGEAEVRWVR